MSEQARSPIEIMIDKACGIDPSKIASKKRGDIEPAAQALLNVADASVKWWCAVSKSTRANAVDHELMRAVEAWLKACGEI